MATPAPKPLEYVEGTWAGKARPAPVTIEGLSPIAALLPDTLGTAGQVLAVNAGGDGLEWVTPA